MTLTGPGGSGKTRLALELAQITRDQRGQQVCFVDLTGLRSSDLVLSSIAAGLGVRDAGDRSIIDAIGMVLSDASRLLVIDNFEHVMPAAAQLADILAVTHRVKILVTSRQPLHLRWEQEYPLSPLDLPDSDEHLGVDAVATASAVQLFVDARPPSSARLHARATTTSLPSPRSRDASTGCRWRSNWPPPASGSSPPLTCLSASSTASTPWRARRGRAQPPSHAARGDLVEP